MIFIRYVSLFTQEVFHILFSFVDKYFFRFPAIVLKYIASVFINVVFIFSMAI